MSKIEVQKPELKVTAKVPRLYNVLLLNDDFTPRQFVVEVLQTFFSMDDTAAQATMLIAHNRGAAACGVYTRELAETKVTQILDYVSNYELPLRFTAEPA